jgi:hypothetical protein
MNSVATIVAAVAAIAARDAAATVAVVIPGAIHRRCGSHLARSSAHVGHTREIKAYSPIRALRDACRLADKRPLVWARWNARLAIAYVLAHAALIRAVA